MLKLIRSLFRPADARQARQSPTTPAELKLGDMLKFADSYALPEDLRGEMFKVQKISTYFYADEPSPQFVIKGGSGKTLFLTIEDFDGDELLVVSKKLKRKEVEDLVGWNSIASGAAQSSLTVRPGHSESAWIAESYQNRVGGGKGIYFESDLRAAHSVPGGGESFTYHEYYSDDETRLLEIEVWDGDEYEVCIGIVRPFSDIAEYWAAS